jgi:hypothetical protein
LSPSPSSSPELITGDYRTPRVADAVDGRFVITWANYDVPATPVVMAQVFASDGNPTTAQFTVPSYGDPYSIEPDVAIADDGTFIITWSGPDLDFERGIHARMYSATGVPLGDQFRVNALANSYYYDPAIAINPTTKAFMVVWSELYLDISITDSDIYGQRFSADGVKVGSTNFKISTGGDGQHRTTDIDVADNGDYVVVYTYEGPSTATQNVYGQRLNYSGTKLGSEFQVNTTSGGGGGTYYMHSRVSFAPSGTFVVTWHVYGTHNIYGQRYTAAGVKAGSEFVVNLDATYSHLYPDVGCDRDGNFVIVWQSYHQPDDPIDSNNIGIVARQYNASGIATTSEYIVNNPSLAHRGLGDQTNPAVARKAGSGQWVTAWVGLQGVAPSGGISNVWHSQTAGNPVPDISLTMTNPLSGSYVAGAIVPVNWTAYGIQSGYTVNLCYATQPNTSGTEYWISVGEITAVNGTASWNWDTTGVPPGIYYIGGYIWNGSTATYGFGATSFTIT